MKANQARKIITVEFWPNTGKWRILVAGVAIGYWTTKDEADLRARQARRGLIEMSSRLKESRPKEV